MVSQKASVIEIASELREAIRRSKDAQRVDSVYRLTVVISLTFLSHNARYLYSTRLKELLLPEVYNGKGA